MKRALIWLAAAVALTGCKIQEAEYFDPTADGYRMLQSANRHLTEAAAAASRAMLFNLYYSASDEERKTLHDRYFYTSRIVDSGNGEWRIIDRDGELVILTGGQPLATDGAVWRYFYLSPTYAETTIACRTNGDETAYDLRLPDGGGELTFTAVFPGRTQEDGATRYWCELSLTGSGAWTAEKDLYGFDELRYRITETPKYISTVPQRFELGQLELTGRIDGDELEATAQYLPDNRITIASGPYENDYYWH